MNAIRKIRVLVVDDNDVIRGTLRGIVRQDDRLEYVGKATCGETAIEALKTLSPDVVCLDIMMPRLDRFAVLASIRDSADKVGVVIVTGSPTSELTAKARELGASGPRRKTLQCGEGAQYDLRRHTGSAMRILIADDDELTRLHLVRLLTQLGHEAVPAADGSEAWNVPRVTIHRP